MHINNYNLSNPDIDMKIYKSKFMSNPWQALNNIALPLYLLENPNLFNEIFHNQLSDINWYYLMKDYILYVHKYAYAHDIIDENFQLFVYWFNNLIKIANAKNKNRLMSSFQFENYF